MDENIEQIFTSVLTEYSPAAAINRAVTVKEGRLQLVDKEWAIDKDKPVYIVGVGKAAPQMVEALSELLQAHKLQRLCIAPTFEDSTPPDYGIVASHPVPDAKSEQAAQKMLAFIQEIPSNSLVLFALSGGTSSLVCKPAGSITLEEMAHTHELLLHSGAMIDEINSVRKHLSQIKGGQLLTYFESDCTLIDLVISDVPNDDLSIIGSGLTTPDSSTFLNAHQILQKYNLWEQLPAAVCLHIKKGLAEEAVETVKPDEDPLDNHHSVIISSAQKLAHKIAEEARNRGYSTWVASEAYNQPVEEVATNITQKIEILRKQPHYTDSPSAFVFYGESTVEVQGSGKGGRNQQLALHAAEAIAGWDGITWLSAGTDGIDGPTDAAGAVVDGDTWQAAREEGIEGGEYLQHNDSYHFHQQMDTLLITGPTGNNLMDLVLVTCNPSI